jgi:hypothetical protein
MRYILYNNAIAVIPAYPVFFPPQHKDSGKRSDVGIAFFNYYMLSATANFKCDEPLEVFLDGGNQMAAGLKGFV